MNHRFFKIPVLAVIIFVFLPLSLPASASSTGVYPRDTILPLGAYGLMRNVQEGEHISIERLYRTTEQREAIEKAFGERTSVTSQEVCEFVRRQVDLKAIATLSDEENIQEQIDALGKDAKTPEEFIEAQKTFIAQHKDDLRNVSQALANGKFGADEEDMKLVFQSFKRPGLDNEGILKKIQYEHRMYMDSKTPTTQSLRTFAIKVMKDDLARLTGNPDFNAQDMFDKQTQLDALLKNEDSPVYKEVREAFESSPRRERYFKPKVPSDRSLPNFALRTLTDKDLIDLTGDENVNAKPSVEKQEILQGILNTPITADKMSNPVYERVVQNFYEPFMGGYTWHRSGAANDDSMNSWNGRYGGANMDQQFHLYLRYNAHKLLRSYHQGAGEVLTDGKYPDYNQTYKQALKELEEIDAKEGTSYADKLREGVADVQRPSMYMYLFKAIPSRKYPGYTIGKEIYYDVYRHNQALKKAAEPRR